MDTFLLHAIFEARMVFTREEKAIIVNYRINHGYGAKKIVAAMKNSKWSVRSVNNVLRTFLTTGGTDRQSGSGRPRAISTPKTVAAIRELALSPENEPGTHRTQRQIAKVLHIHRSSVQRIIRNELHLRSFKKVPLHSLNAAQKQQRLEKSRALLRLPASSLKKIIFTDEKNFTLSAPRNSQNDRVNGMGTKAAISISRLQRQQEQFSQHVMVSAGVSYRGKTRLHFVEPGVKVNADYYSNTLLRQGLIPDCVQLFPDRNFIFQQDSAPSHTARLTVHFLQEQNIPFWGKEVWPAKSPDLNPMDYRVWALLEQKVYETVKQYPSIESLKAALVRAWESLNESTIRKCIIGDKGFRKRLEAVVAQNGGHVETLFRKC